MKKIIVATAILLAPLLGLGSEPDHVARLRILFPETKDGVTVADLPLVSREWLQDKREGLKSGFLRNNRGRLVEDEECSFITQVLSGQANLYVGDITTNGVSDVVYAGPALCQEGHATVIWHGWEDGQGRWSGSWRPRILMSKVLRIQRGARPGLAGMASSCCGKPTTEYYSYFDGRNNYVDVHNQMVYPDVVLPERQSFSVVPELVLRSSPHVLKKDSQDKSQSDAHDVNGDILRKFLGGVAAEILATKKDEDGTIWAFVKVDRSYWHLSYYAAVETGVGWTNNVRQPACSTDPPWEAEATLSSPNGTKKVTHYTLTRGHPDVWSNNKSCLRASDSGSSWWVPRTHDTIFRIGEFIDDSHLLVSADRITWGRTLLIDLDTRVLKELACARGTYIRQGKNSGLVRCGSKSYRVGGGAYWYSMLVDLDGNVVEILASRPGLDGPNCMRVGAILRTVEQPPTLRQSLDTLVGCPDNVQADGQTD